MASASVAAALGDPEILGLILKKVQPRHDILVAAGVSKLWRRTAHTTCSALVVPNKWIFKEYCKLQCIRHFSLHTSLRISDYYVSENTPFFLGGLAAAFPRLRDLRIHVASASNPIAPDNLKGLLESFPLLGRFTYVSTRGLPQPQVLSTLSHIKVLEVWLGANLPESFYDLTTLRDLTIVDKSSELRISPSITRLVNLTRLFVLTSSFDALPTSFGVVPSLNNLELHVHHRDVWQVWGSMPDLRGLPRLKTLTVSFITKGYYCFDLSWNSLRLPASLVDLSLVGLPVSALPEGWEDLSSLQSLTLWALPYLEEIPSSVGMLNSLKELVVRDCPRLRHFPDGIGRMTHLQDLSIRSCASLEFIPRGLKDLLTLKRLRVEDCPNLLRLPWQLEKLIEESVGEDLGIE